MLTTLKHPFIKKAKNQKILMVLIDKLNNKIKEAGGRANLMKTLNKKQGKTGGGSDSDDSDSDDYKKGNGSDSDDDDDSDSGTMVRKKNGSDSDSDSDSGTMVRKKNKSDSDSDSDSGTMVRKKKSKSDSEDDEDSEGSGSGTLVVKKKKKRKPTNGSGDEEEDEGTASDGSDGYRVKIPEANSDDSGAEENDIVFSKEHPKPNEKGSDSESDLNKGSNSETKDYYTKWNKELLEQQLAMLEEEYQKELNEIQQRYKTKKDEIKKAIAQFKNKK